LGVVHALAMTRTMTLIIAVAAVFLVIMVLGLVLTEHALVVAGLALTVQQEIPKLALAAAV